MPTVGLRRRIYVAVVTDYGLKDSLQMVLNDTKNSFLKILETVFSKNAARFNKFFVIW